VAVPGGLVMGGGEVEALTIFLSAFLLFQVELIVGKELLPWFGGAPSVWTTCLVFFQSVLLAGYAYAHLIVSKLGLPRQLGVHIVVVALSVSATGVPGDPLAFPHNSRLVLETGR